MPKASTWERSCEDEVVEQLVELRRRAAEYAARDGRIAADVGSPGTELEFAL